MTDTQEEVKGMEQAFMSLADDYNEVARALGFEGRGFYGDVPDKHEDIVKQAADLRAKVLTRIASDGQLIEENRALRARVEELTALATDLARSLECEIKGNYSDAVLEHPGMKRRFDRDMSEVLEARSILNK